MKAVLFDIDGTLIKAGGAGRSALARGAARALGLPFDEVAAVAGAMDFRGRIDPHLIDELVRRLGANPDEHDHRVQSAYLEELPALLGTAPLEVMPGIRELLGRLDARGDVVVGLLTGNVRAGARLKLGAFGLDWLVDRPGGFGEDGEDRTAVARAGVRQAVAAGARPDAIWVIGDTEHDVAAAKGAGAHAVAVATGWTPREVLVASGPDLVVDDLADPAPLFALIDA